MDAAPRNHGSAPDDEVRLYRPRDKRVPLSFKVPASLKQSLLLVVRLWKYRSKIDGQDPDDIDLTYVCEQLLALGIDVAWTEIAEPAGLSVNGEGKVQMPESDEDWERLEKSLARAAKNGNGAPKRTT